MTQLQEINQLAYFSQEALIGKKNSDLLKQVKITVIGAGGTGSFATGLLAKIGVKLRVIDPDYIDPTNLSRQNLYGFNSIGNSKVQEIKKQLLALNPLLEIEAIEENLTTANAKIILKSSDVVLDCSDNYQARIAIDYYCWNRKIPWIYCAAIKDECMISTFLKSASASFSKVFPKQYQCLSCSTEGVLATTVSTAATLAVHEVINVILKKPALCKKVLKVNLTEMQFKTFNL